MVYFRENEQEETKRQQVLDISAKDHGGVEESYIESDYDDGFDDPSNEPEEISEDEQKEIRAQHFRLASGAANIAAVIGGTLLILILLTLIFSIIHFVIKDMGRNFSLFQTNF